MTEISMPPEPRDPGLTDARQLWLGDSQPGPAPLHVIRLDASERALIAFTTQLLRVLLHYCDAPAIKGYAHCLGEDCLLCRLGRQAETRDLWPLFDPTTGSVGILPISPNVRPHALRPQLAPLMERLARGERPLLTVRRPESTRFEVRVLELPEGVDDGARAIAQFVEQLEAGTLNLGAVYPRLSNQDLATVPELAREMALRGIAG